MSTSHNGEAGDGSSVDRPLGSRVRRSAVAVVERTALWAAIALPFCYVPVLLTGVETHVELTAVVALLAANVLTSATAGLGTGERR